MKIVWGDKSEIKSINVYQTVSFQKLISLIFIFFLLCVKKNIIYICVWLQVSELKKTLEPICGIAASKMRLYYVDQDYMDTHNEHEFMKYPNKQIYSYNIASGDEILVDTK